MSLVTGPSGATVSDELSDAEGILYADVDVAKCVEPKQFHDISGGYNRFDIFKLTVDRSANRPVTFVSGEATAQVPESRQTDDSEPTSHDE